MSVAFDEHGLERNRGVLRSGPGPLEQRIRIRPRLGRLGIAEELGGQAERSIGAAGGPGVGVQRDHTGPDATRQRNRMLDCALRQRGTVSRYKNLPVHRPTFSAPVQTF